MKQIIYHFFIFFVALITISGCESIPNFGQRAQPKVTVKVKSIGLKIILKAEAPILKLIGLQAGAQLSDRK